MMSIEGARENICGAIDDLYAAQPKFIEGGDWLKEGESLLRRAKRCGDASEKHVKKVQDSLVELAKHLAALAEITGEGAELAAQIKERTIWAWASFETADKKVGDATEKSVAAIGTGETARIMGYPPLDTIPEKLIETATGWKEKAQNWGAGFAALHTKATELTPQIQAACTEAEELPGILSGMERPVLGDAESLGDLGYSSFQIGDGCTRVIKVYEGMAERMGQ